MLIIKHIGPRLHRFLYGFFGSSDVAEVKNLQANLKSRLKENLVSNEYDQKAYCWRLANGVGDSLSLSDELTTETGNLIWEIVEFEEFFAEPIIDWNVTHTTSDLWGFKDELNEKISILKNFSKLEDALGALALNTMSAIHTALGDSGEVQNQDGIIVPTSRIDRMSNLPQTVEHILVSVFDEDLVEANLFARLRERLQTNLILASGGNPNDPAAYNKPTKNPTKSDEKNPSKLVGSYLGRTPYYELFDGEEHFLIPQQVRYEHHHIIAGTGHGKTQTLQYLLSKDFEAVAAGERTVIVIDSQTDLIDKIRKMKIFAPGEPLHDRICVIDPSDVEFPVALNMFDVGQDRLDEYDPASREKLTNSILELYDYVLASLLSAGMTQKQDVLFGYVTRLMLVIPDATIHTFRELMEPGSEVTYAEHISKLDGSAKHFFEKEFAGKEFAQTRSQVLRRLHGILKNQTFERMFSSPRSKFDMYTEMNAGKVILINTAKDFLKKDGTEIFGRFFIALIAQAAQERAVLPANKRMSTMVYVDEAAEYLDDNVETILSQARKYKVGMVLAHQYLGQLGGKLQDAFSANTSIKFAGGFSGREARSAAQYLGCDVELITKQPKGGFATFIKGVTKSAISLKLPPFAIDNAPQMSAEEYQILKDKMRDLYAVPATDLKTDDDDGNNGSDDGGPSSGPKPGPTPNPDGPQDPNVDVGPNPSVDDVIIDPSNKW